MQRFCQYYRSSRLHVIPLKKRKNFKQFEKCTCSSSIATSSSATFFQQHVPFAVVGSNDEVKVTSGTAKTTRVRQYHWGTVYIENEQHCDFVKLREMLVRTNMDDLRERTHAVHYEHYRRARLSEMGFRDDEKLSLQVSACGFLASLKEKNLLVSCCSRTSL